MPSSRGIRLAWIACIAIAVAGCDAAAEIGLGAPAGFRALVVTVRNDSPRPATLFVAQDEGSMGAQIGTVTPAVIPAGATMDVTFRVPPEGVPPEGEWGIFVNPGPGLGPLVTVQDVPADAAGRMPFKIIVGRDGSPSAQLSGETSGWFGQP